MDKHGNCPNCGVSWEGSDVQAELNSLSVFKYKSDKNIEAIAGNYGHSLENRITFSKVIVIEKEDKVLYRCPNIRCSKIYDSETGEEVILMKVS